MIIQSSLVIILVLIILLGSCVIDLAGVHLALIHLTLIYVHIGGHVLLGIALEPVKRIQRFECNLFASVRLHHYGRIPRLPSLIRSIPIFIAHRYIVLALWFEHQAVFKKPFVSIMYFIFWGTASTFTRQKCVL